ncbi:hypothetical protein ACIQI8_44895, partial [Streptomyces sp. NPDC092369]|uniref:hypothetical protein n=1 Tax=Streptomyces sp. NPDC092369 TaxID=3366015 RepID=UPI00381F98B7
MRARDIEGGVDGLCPPDALVELLEAMAGAVNDQGARCRCRRVVFAPDGADQARVEAAGTAPFRYVLGLDLGPKIVSLFVAEAVCGSPEQAGTATEFPDREGRFSPLFRLSRPCRRTVLELSRQV